MTTSHLHIIGCDPGGKTGLARFTIPRDSIFGNEPAEIWDMDFKLFAGPEPEQVLNIARYTRETQSLDYKTGPALVVEGWYNDPSFKSSDPEALSPVRIGAMLTFLMFNNDKTHTALLGDATLTFQDRTIAMTTMTDERLKKRNLYGNQKDIRAATKHALTALRRAKQDPEFARTLWPR